MSGPDDEFDDFLRRRRPMFGQPGDGLEPPAELDRIVLRQAREAIEAEKPQRMFRAPSWGMPVALAATLVLAFTIILRVGMPAKEATPEVTVRNVARTVEYPPPPAAAPASAPAPAPAQPNLQDAPIVVDLAASAAEAPAAPARRLEKVADSARSRPAAEMTGSGELPAEAAANSAKAEVPAPEWRRDSQTWLAEIERLRASGDVARADAELTEYKRQHRAYAGAPDR
jgi:hypothetical protein